MKQLKLHKDIEIESLHEVKLLNRYLSFSVIKKFGKKQKLLSQRSRYTVQWQNIRYDIEAMFQNPFKAVPRVAMSLAAFYFIIQGRHDEAIQTSFLTPLFGLAITQDGTTVSVKQDATEAVTVASNSDRAMVVAIGTHQANNASGITYNSVSMTLVKRQTGSFGEHCEVWGLVAPSTGTNNVVVSGANNFWAMGIYSLYNCKQSLPTVTGGANAGSGNPTASVTTTVDGSWVIGVVSSEATPTISVGTQDWTQDGSNSYERARGAHAVKATAGSQALTWTNSFGARWQVAMLVWEPAPVVTTVGITKSLQYAVKAPKSSTLSLKYTIKAAASALTKALKYVVKITPAAITKSLRYAVVKPATPIEKQLTYMVKRGVPINRSLQYTVKSPKSVTRSLKYAVVKTAAAVTKVLRYMILKQIPEIYNIQSIAGNTLTNYTVPADTDLLIVGVGNHQGTISGASWNGNAMTEIDGIATAFNETYRWYMIKNPTPGTGTITPTFGGGDGRTIIAFCVFGAKTGGWTPVTNKSQGSSAGPSLSLTTPTKNCLVIEGTYAEAARTAVGAGQTSIANVNISSFQNGFASYEPAANPGSVAMSNTFASGQRYAMVAFVIEPATSEVSITRSLKYTILKSIGITRSLKYTVKAPKQVTKALQYAVKKSQSISKSLRYDIKTRFFSRNNEAILPNTDDALANAYTNDEFANTLTDDSSNTNQLAENGEYAIHLFKAKNTNNQSFIRSTIIARSDVPTSTSPMVLQVFNQVTNLWETVDTDNSTGAGTDITLTAYITSNMPDYYDAQNEITYRVYQQAPANATDFQLGHDMMGITKDIMRQSINDQMYQNHVDAIMRDYPNTDTIAISFPNTSQAEASAQGVAPFAEEPWARKNRLMDMIHDAGANVEDRFTDPYFEGIYDFPKTNKRNGNRYTFLGLPIYDNFEQTGTRQHGYGLTSPGGSFSRYIYGSTGDSGNIWTFGNGKIIGPAANGWNRRILFRFDGNTYTRNGTVLALVKKVGNQQVLQRSTQDNNFPGYGLQLRTNTLVFERPGLAQIGSSVTKAMTEGAWYWVKFQAIDYDLKGKVWLASGENETKAEGALNEPAGWDIERTHANDGTRISPDTLGYVGFSGESNFGEFAYLEFTPQHDADTWLARGLDPVITNIAHYASGDYLSAYPEATGHWNLDNQGNYNQFFIDWSYCVDWIGETYGKTLNGKEAGHLMTYALQGQFNTLYNAVGVAAIDAYGAAIGRGKEFGSSSNDSGAAGTQTYSVPTSITENSANRQDFIPEKIAYNKVIRVYIVNKGSGDLTMTIHTASNQPVRMYDHTDLDNSWPSYTLTIPNASLPSSGWVDFLIDWHSLQTDQTHHFHLTSTQAGTTIKTTSAGDMNTCSFIQNKWHATVEAYEIDIRNLARITGKPVKIKEWGDFWSKDASRTDPVLSNAEHLAYLADFYAMIQRLKDDGVATGFTYWRTGFGIEGIYNNASNPWDYQPLYNAAPLQDFFDANPDSSPEVNLAIDFADFDFVLPDNIMKTLRYTIRKPIAITKSLRYVVRTNPYTKKPSPYSRKDSPYTPF